MTRAELIARMEYALRSHLAWAVHLESHAASGVGCDECDLRPYKLDSGEEREWVRVYEGVIEVLKEDNSGMSNKYR